jgi:hypothetical protein
LIYSDAPDITSLDNGGPFATAQLGRIGQECNPPSIKNVIEWQRPEWAASLPFSGNELSRVLQKVCCEGVASSSTTVDLSIVGLEINGRETSSGESSSGSNGLMNSILNGPSAFFESNPLDLKGPLTAPFGKFDILYLDDDMRITKTYQGYYAVNTRISKEDEWF